MKKREPSRARGAPLVFRETPAVQFRGLVPMRLQNGARPELHVNAGQLGSDGQLSSRRLPSPPT
jgi:hypothetical protein